MDKLQNQDSFQEIMLPIPVIVDTNWLETAPGPARTMNSGVALPQSVNNVSMFLFLQNQHEYFHVAIVSHGSFIKKTFKILKFPIELQNVHTYFIFLCLERFYSIFLTSLFTHKRCSL